METIESLSKKKFAVYGLGLSGSSVVKFLKKLKALSICTWDDNKKININSNSFSKALEKVDYIVVSPGINIKKSKFKKILAKNKKKIITDLDLFYMANADIKSAAITGTNGKSTACKLLEQVLKKANIDVQLGGNIGKPILDLKIRNKSFVVIEASSFQLAYSKFIKPNYAVILNIADDHLDWHGTKKNYINSKLKIFRNQDKNDFALVNNKKNISLFKKNNFLSELISVKQNIPSGIKNRYLLSKPNKENLTFVYSISKILNIKKIVFLNAVNKFKGLPHRHEIFYKKKGITFINNSKATSFDATKHALKSNKNIFWIVGGLNKLGDKFNIKKLNKNIVKAFVVGKKTSFFTKQLKGKVDYIVTSNLNNTIKQVFKELTIIRNKNITVLFSPSAASYDQFKNFVQRGDSFKKLVKNYANKYF